MALKTRKPSGRVAPPLILLEGGEKVGKSYTTALLSASDKVGRTYWIEFGEVTADEYGAVPGARYEIVEHDGSFRSLYQAVADVREEAQKAKDAGDKPVVLVIDQMGAIWDLLKDWAYNRARGSRSNRAKLAADPNAEINISTNYWNDANDRHQKIMKLLRTFPGIVVMLARGKETALMGKDGQPVEGKKEYKVEGQKGLAFDTAHWIRLVRGEGAYLIGVRRAVNGIKAAEEPPQRLRANWSLEWFVFEFLGFDLANSDAPELVEPKPERTPEQIADEAMLPSTTTARVAELWAEAKDLDYGSVVVPNEHGQEELLPTLLKRKGLEKKAADPASTEQHRHMHALWREAGEFEDRDDRLNFTREIIGRDIQSSSELTAAEADKVVGRLKQYIEQIRERAEQTEADLAQMAGVPT